MLRPSNRLRTLAFLALLGGCGSSFTSGAADSGSGNDGGGGMETGPLPESGMSEGSTAESGADVAPRRDAAPPPEGGIPGAGTYCGPGLTCSGPPDEQGTICCIGVGGSSGNGCAGSSCGCATQLDCSLPSDCPSKHCCINQQMDGTCGGGHFVARCQAICLAKEEMCDPMKPTSCGPLTRTCVDNTGKVGIPSGSGFGICQ